jgi:hypothetical protein
MKTIKIKFTLIMFFLVILLTKDSAAQTWNGSTTSNGLSYRLGNTAIGLSNPQNNTRLWVKSDNLKAGIVSQHSHTTDFQHGIMSIVNRSNTNAFDVFLGSGSSFTQTFSVLGNGHVYATEITVKNAPVFPDYVFDESYDLLSLYETELYIKKHHRLPNIPSANEICLKGLSLGVMQVKQMEKIEELTLHMIEMKKESDSLKKENIRLEEENKKMKADIEKIMAHLKL